MRLIINNIMKFSHADILIDGITVVAGENNTGKSTLGKCLWAVTEAMYGLETFTFRAKLNSISMTLSNLGNELDLLCKELSGAKRRKKGKIDKLQEKYAKELIRGFEDRALKKKITEYRDEHIRSYGLEITEEIAEATKLWIENTFKEIRTVVDLDDDLIGCDKITRVFSEVFNEQFIKSNKESAEIEVINEQGKANIITFKHNNIEECVSLKRVFRVGNRAYYIGTPELLDKFDIYSHIFFENVDRGECLRQLLTPFVKINVLGFDNVKEEVLLDLTKDNISALLMKQKLENVSKNIKEILNGRFITENGRLKFKDVDSGAVFPIGNMSEGLKAVALVERVLTYGLLKKDTVLVLDEPEINLHPEWQLRYAEIIVMLQKALELKVILTTHSPYFLKAIEYYSKRYKNEGVCHYYYTQNCDGTAEIENVDEMVDIIFKKLAVPLVRITDTEE